LPPAHDATARLSTATLLDIADSWAADAAADHPPLVDAGRGYELLIRTPSFEAWLIDWARSGALDLHDHGGSVGAVRVVAGTLVEAYTDLDQRRPLRSQRLSAGEGLRISARRVHEIWNPGPAPARSIHVYSPPLGTMTYYDPDRFLVT
jgi:predicted metal-dependent enzyme (double-stranded beta helix superfamily)